MAGSTARGAAHSSALPGKEIDFTRPNREFQKTRAARGSGRRETYARGALGMNIVLVGLELAPGLARTPAAESLLLLAKALRLLDFEVTLVLPYLEELRAQGLLAARRLTPLELPKMGPTFVYESTLPSGAKLCLLESKELPSPRFDSFRGEGSDSLVAWLSEAVVEWVSERTRHGTPPDVVHALGARAAVALGGLRVEDGAIARAMTVFDPSDLKWVREGMGSDPSLAGLGRGAGFSAAEAIVVPSQELAAGVRSLLGELPTRSRAQTHVVFEGIDTGAKNPATDPALPHRYTPYDLTGKKRTQRAIRESFGLSLDPERPFLVVNLKTAEEGTRKKVALAVPSWVRQGFTVGLALDGNALPELGPVLAELADQVAVVRGSAKPEAQRLFAAADFYWEPESTDATGRAILEAQRYGALPVAGPNHFGQERVLEFDAELSSGTGFTVSDPELEGLVALGGRLLAAFRRPQFSGAVTRVMALDLAWDRPGRRHAQIYKALLDGSSAPRRTVSLG